MPDPAMVSQQPHETGLARPPPSLRYHSGSCEALPTLLVTMQPTCTLHKAAEEAAVHAEKERLKRVRSTDRTPAWFLWLGPVSVAFATIGLDHSFSLSEPPIIA